MAILKEGIQGPSVLGVGIAAARLPGVMSTLCGGRSVGGGPPAGEEGGGRGGGEEERGRAGVGVMAGEVRAVTCLL